MLRATLPLDLRLYQGMELKQRSRCSRSTKVGYR
jgi:hypothetical protein